MRRAFQHKTPNPKKVKSFSLAPLSCLAPKRPWLPYNNVNKSKSWARNQLRPRNIIHYKHRQSPLAGKEVYSLRRIRRLGGSGMTFDVAVQRMRISKQSSQPGPSYWDVLERMLTCSKTIRQLRFSPSGRGSQCDLEPPYRTL